MNKELEKQEEENKAEWLEDDENDDESSPRGVWETPISGSDSDQSSLCSFERSSSFERGIAGDYGNMHWKKLFGQVKKPSVWKMSTISLLGGANTTKKAIRKKIGRKSNSEEAIDGGDFVMPKPSWRNFRYEELRQATNDFSPGN